MIRGANQVCAGESRPVIDTHKTELAERLLSIPPRLIHLLRRERARMRDDDSLAGVLSERRGQVRLLHILLHHPRLTTQELAQLLDVSPPTVSTMVRALAEHQLVTRERDGADQRQVWISLTERGREAVEDERARMREVFLVRFEQLDESDQALIASAVPALERLLEVHPSPCHQNQKDS